MNAKHTPGPWSVTHGEIFSNANDALIAKVMSGADSAPLLSKAIGSAEADRNASRIVACVNACEGMSTDDLMAGRAVLMDSYDALRAENERLREALQNALNVLAGIATGDLKTVRKDSPAIAQARAALAGGK